jgi:hypothetical protein
MKQPVATTINGAITIIEQLADGVGTYPALNVTHNTKPILLTKRQEAIEARNNYELSKQSLRVVRDALEQTRLDSRGMLMLSRDILKPNFGDEFNINWTMLGFEGSLATPLSVDDLAIQMEAVVNFFTANPELEVVTKNVTAAQASTLHAALVAGRKAVNDKETAVAETLAARNVKFGEMQRRIRFTIDELSGILDPLDPRWKAFGLNIPGAEQTPDVPFNIRFILTGSNTAAVKWDVAPRADYYRVWTRIHGSTDEYVAVGSPADLDFTIENLPAATAIDIVVTAVNSGGQSAFSQVVTITTH